MNRIYCSTEENVTYILDGLRMSKLTVNVFSFWVSYPFKQSLDLYIVVDNHEKQTFIMVILSDLINSINQAKPIKKYIYRHVLYLFMSQKDMLTIVRVVC